MAVPPGYSTAQDYFEDTLNFLKAYHWIYSSPNTHILVDKIFEQIPCDWIPFVNSLESEELKKVISGNQDQIPSSLKDFLQTIKKLELPKIKKKIVKIDFSFPNNSGLSDKKRHEIVSLAPLIKEISDESNCNLIVDVGTGLGYLPQLLHKKYGYRIIGIEGNPKYVKLAKLNQLKYAESTSAVEYIEHFVTVESEEELKSMVGKISVTGARTACITGLHACADLSVTMLELFSKLDFAKSLVIMPCCYHRLKRNEHGFENFPASNLLKGLSKKAGIGNYLNIPFLRLACQGSIDGFVSMTQEEREKHASSCLFRAILQEVAESENCQVKRLKRKSGKLTQSTSINEDFETYLAKLKDTHTLIGADISHDQFLGKMREKWTHHKGKLRLIEALATFQAALQSVCENVVLLDRVVFLKEKGVDCFVVRVTDQGISPRCYALVAKKL